MSISLYTTADKSHTLYNPELDETYHSRNGAVEEALHVFLKEGFLLKTGTGPSLNILEIGFGTGLNAILTLIEANRQQAHCHYFSLETYPLPVPVIDQLNYTDFIPASFHPAFKQMHKADWNKEVQFPPFFALSKINESIHHFKPDHSFDLVYFDAFGPDKQPDMWTIEVFENMFSWMNPGGVLVTYSAKGDVRRALKQVGFTVELIPGPPRKRHMLRAIKP